MTVFARSSRHPIRRPRLDVQRPGRSNGAGVDLANVDRRLAFRRNARGVDGREIRANPRSTSQSSERGSSYGPGPTMDFPLRRRRIHALSELAEIAKKTASTPSQSVFASSWRDPQNRPDIARSSRRRGRIHARDMTIQPPRIESRQHADQLNGIACRWWRYMETRVGGSAIRRHVDGAHSRGEARDNRQRRPRARN